MIHKANMVENEAPPHGQPLTFYRTRASVSFRYGGWIFTPTLAVVMQNRWLLALIAGSAVLQIGLAAAGCRGWECPIRFISGIPCPGCGLSRAMALFIQGHWQSALEMHAFAPIILAAVGCLAVTAIMPRGIQHQAVRHVATWEKRSGIIAIVLMAMFIYWGLRLSGLLGSMAEI